MLEITGVARLINFWTGLKRIDCSIEGRPEARVDVILDFMVLAVVGIVGGEFRICACLGRVIQS